MLFSGINIKNELIRYRSHQPDLLRQVNDLLRSAAESDKDILNRLKKNNPGGRIAIDVDDAENIFSLDEIRRICIRYRLRFLESGHFKAEYPYDAIGEIRAFEKKYDLKIQSFHIIAPSEAFELENINKDPLLFAQLNENNFYLLHQWGRDLRWFRRIASWPLQSFKTLLLTLLVAGGIFAFSLPATTMNVFTLQSSLYLRIWLTVHMFIGLTGLTIWAGMAFDKSLSEMNWNSKYYNY